MYNSFRYVLNNSAASPPLPAIIKKNNSIQLLFNASNIIKTIPNSNSISPENCRYKLRLIADVQCHPAWMYEGGLPYLYRDIDDALTTETHHSRYALKITANNEEWQRCAYYKIVCPPMINSQYAVPTNGGQWTFSCYVKTENLIVNDEGCAEIIFESFLQEFNKDNRDICTKKSIKKRLKLPIKTTNWQKVCCNVPINDSTSAMLVSVVVKNATGSVFLEDPCIQNNHGYNILPQFDETNRYYENFNWFGENLSQKEWTKLNVIVNGIEMPTQELFKPCFRSSENEIELPIGSIKSADNKIVLTNVCSYRAPLPWKLEQAEILVEPVNPVNIIWTPKTVSPLEAFGVLLKTYEDDISISIKTWDGLVAPKNLKLSKKGLHALRLTAPRSGSHLKFSICANGIETHSYIQRIVVKENDDVITGSADAIYVPQDIALMENFLIWYLENDLGNMITFRPVYRWSGSRACNEKMWKHIANLCEHLNLYYCVILDGRELSGLNANPSLDMLNSKYYLGHQAHERDGALYYWLQRKHPTNDIFYEELCYKNFEHKDFLRAQAIEYHNNNVNFCFSSTYAQNMKEASEQFTNRLKPLLQGIKRHTGPSTLYKYFFEAGLEVGGAELMYGPHEIAIAALRGASKAYNKKQMAAHLAVQWGTTPHNTLSRYRRYQLALFVSYIQGIHHINTEEGLYRMEEMFATLDRFSDACMEHAKIQREFLQFVSTHTRRGTLMCNCAFLHGQYDGWTCFCRREVWAQEGEQWLFNTPEESWDLLKIFYPDSVLDAIYRHPCPDEPQGYFSKTPYSNVDILPIEAPQITLNSYSHLAFIGFNVADKTQVKKLKEFVSSGGKLLLGATQMFMELSREKAFGDDPNVLDLTELCAIKINGFHTTEEHLGIGKLEYCNAQIIKKQNGMPLLIKNKLGKGEVWFVNSKYYAADIRVKKVYEQVLTQFAKQSIQNEPLKGWLSSENCVEHSIYNRPDGLRVIYAISTCWYCQTATQENATLYIKNTKYCAKIKRDYINIFTINNNVAIQTADVQTDVVFLVETQDNIKISLQGYGEAELTIYFNGECKAIHKNLNGFSEILLDKLDF